VNQYGAARQQHQKRWRPASYAAVSDPRTYLTDLGELGVWVIAGLGENAPRPEPAR
jgi:hypothetical protein